MRIIAVPLLFVMASAPSLACVGDCDGDATVGVSEIIRGVNIALGISPIESCPAFAGPGNTGVSISRLVSAVNAALYGCLGGETPTVQASPTLTPPVLSLSVPPRHHLRIRQPPRRSPHQRWAS